MKILLIGDIYGKPGREAVKKVLTDLREDREIDLVIANAENLHHGKGVSDNKIQELRKAGVDFFTSGNHIWKLPEIFAHMEKAGYPLIRPANYPEDTPGRGWDILELEAIGTKSGKAKKHPKVAVINLMARVFMPGNLDDPFRKADEILKEIGKLGKDVQAIIVDFHGEATAEKKALGLYLDGRVSAVFGTHTHVPTADEMILENGTAFQTDIGMTGVLESVIGADKKAVIGNFLTQMPHKFEVAEGLSYFNALLVEINDKSGLAENIERIQIRDL